MTRYLVRSVLLLLLRQDLASFRLSQFLPFCRPGLWQSRADGVRLSTRALTVQQQLALQFGRYLRNIQILVFPAHDYE